MNVLCLGDSLTETYGINPEFGWVELLKSALKINTINAGICGDTTSGMLSRCESLLLKHKPSHLIILGGTNDLWFGLKDEFIISNIQAISRHAKYHGVDAIVGLPTLSYNLNELNFIQENYSECIRHFRSTLIQYCNLEAKPFIDFGFNMTYKHVLDDGLHPNEEGQKIMMNNVFKVLKD
ncbi:GDSL-type esterase/lipase family protein [Hanstruepera marina]|uniref:GDSL-type esterase/lipase family protein n=1 Tax=Hanstruepera marina TaxID=2873265 RepID=UPI001CA6AC83|nr:GDSL-type esterase/lipase family protein [Hanstruepera marina]